MCRMKKGSITTDTGVAGVTIVELVQAVPGGNEEEEKGEETNDHELKACVQQYSTQYVGKHHVEKCEVDFDIEEEEEEVLAAYA